MDDVLGLFLANLAAFIAGAVLRAIREASKRKKDPYWEDVLRAVCAAIEDAPVHQAKPIKEKVKYRARESGQELHEKLDAFIKAYIQEEK